MFRFFKKVIGVTAYVYWIPFFYTVKNGHSMSGFYPMSGFGEASLDILLFFFGIFLAKVFLSMCKHDPIDKDELQLTELYVDEVPANLRVITTWFGEIVVGVLLQTPLQMWMMTCILFVLLWKINWWIYNPIFLFWNFRFCKVRQVASHEDFYFMMTVELKDIHHKAYLHFDEYKICRYDGKMDWIAFRNYR